MRPVVRSVTYFAPLVKDPSELEKVLVRAVTLLEEVEKALEGRGYSVFSKRVSLPQNELGLSRVLELVDKAGAVNRGVLVSVGSQHIRKADLEDVTHVLLNGLYTSLLFDYERPLDASKTASTIIHKVSEADPSAGTRLAIGFHERPLETPYFPDSTSSGVEGVGLSFLYPDYLRSLVESGASVRQAFDKLGEEVDSVVHLVRSVTGLRVVVDYSLSPWKENSVIRLMEAIGYYVRKPGFHFGVMTLNAEIRRIATSSGLASGFNEVMLPYAEDDSLIQLGSRGALTAYDLLSYTTVCVAGPDMIVVPWSIDDLEMFTLDAYSVSLVKARPAALRAIPVTREPTETVNLGKFGRVPVIPYYPRK
ncbi:DUF711 family protein [Thermogladius sp.]|uniref:DUF711 family protein n=1 Tax=Thermogladius sp. TaxID=2023064 RepID=UPI003D0D40CF